jgi:D-hydroxyproline dehydrogenase subunit gamma
MPERVRLSVDGNEVRVPVGTSVAAAVVLGGAPKFCTSVSGEPRAAVCGMGICFECRLTIDGRPGVRSCQIAVRDGMRIQTS